MRESELACKCCGLKDLDPKLIPALLAVEKDYGEELRFSSGCRCEKHNRDEGGEDDSRHLPPCRGVDIISAAKDVAKRKRLYDTCKKHGFVGFGRGATFLHADFGPPREWGYPVKKESPKVG